MDREFETIPTRPQDKFNVHPEDIETFRKVIVPYWKGKSLEDVIKNRFGDEISAISKVVKVNQTDHHRGIFVLMLKNGFNLVLLAILIWQKNI